MAQKHLFGRPLSVLFRPHADDEDVTAYSLTSAKIYDEDPRTSSPTEIESVASWTATGVGEYTVGFAALADAEPGSFDDYEKYYVKFTYKPVSGGADQYDVETIFVYRPDSHTSKIDVTASDVFNLESRIQDVAPTVLWVEACIENAIDDVIAKLEARGYKKRQVFNWQKLNGCVARLATAYACDKLSSQGNQFWATKSEKWEERAWTMFEAAKIGYDIAGDDAPETPEETKFSGAVFVAR